MMLSEWAKLVLKLSNDMVLILVLVDDALWAVGMFYLYTMIVIVLILVLVDDALWVLKSIIDDSFLPRS